MQEREDESRSVDAGSPPPEREVGHDVVLWINDQRVVIRDPDPRTLLLDYLRSDEVGLTGTKKACGQGGCGACTVTLHRFDPAAGQVVHTAINACLRPVCSLDGMAITTVEGVGSVATEVSPVQYQVATNNATQCGYCTPGWVMSMHSYLVAHPDKPLTQLEIEQLFDGNLCRCTGFRPLLYAMRHFAADFGPADERNCMKCLVDPKLTPKQAAREPNRVPAELQQPPRPLAIERDGYTWHRPLTLPALLALLDRHARVDDVRMVVGNTSIGIYGEPAQGVTFGPPHVRIDISHLRELHGVALRPAAPTGGPPATLEVGAAVTYSELLAALDRVGPGLPAAAQPGLDALRYMAQRTAGRIVRDAASLAGNTMLVVQHIDHGTPFPSDLFTALCTLGATVEVICPRWPAPERFAMLGFAARWRRDPEVRRGAVILRYAIPLTGPGAWARTFKVALREVNAHSIVNAGFRVTFDAEHRVTAATAVLGGVGPLAFHLAGLEAALIGRRWDADTLAHTMPIVRREVVAQLEATRAWMRDVPQEGFTDAYRTHLAETYYYQYFVWLAEQLTPARVPPPVRSAGERPVRPLSRGTQRYAPPAPTPPGATPLDQPVGQPLVKIEAFAQTTGEARYTHDVLRPAHGLDGAIVVSTVALAASWSFAIPTESGPRPATTAELAAVLAARFPGFVDLVTAADIPGKNDQQWAGPPDPLLCPPTSGVTAAGQALAVVLAERAQQAIDVAYWVQQHAIVYLPVLDPHDRPVAPILSLDEAATHPDRVLTTAGNLKSIVRPGSQLDWAAPDGPDEVVLGGVACRVVRGAQASRTPQLHFYMEPQAAIAVPGEPGPTSTSMRVITSTQNPVTVRNAVAGALGLPANLVEVDIQRLGGGYGGKGPRTPWCGALAAVAARKHRRPVRLGVPRETDTALFGHANPLTGRYAIAIGTGADQADHRGKLMGLSIDYWLDAGNTADCSPIVMDCVQLRGDNAYRIPNYQTTGRVVLTNTISNTSFRTLEAVSGVIILEDALEHAAHAIGMAPEDVRGKNLYQLGDLTPYGQSLAYCYLDDVWAFTRTSWPTAQDPLSFEARAAAIAAWNTAHRWKKRGISMVPVKYGMGFNLAAMERGDALVEIHADGSVLVRHGGVEMGQGLNTQVTQLVAQALNVALSRVRIGTTSTAVIPDPTSTGASTGTAYNGGAARKAGQILRARLEAFCAQALREHGRAWCQAQHIDYWSYDRGWQHVVDAQTGKTVWDAVIGLAGAARVNLSAQAQHDETGGTASDTGLVFWAPDRTETVQQFVGFTYSAAISEVEVDVLTGEVTILRSDLVYDMGQSLNPATDVGQIEGAFIQGVGRVLTEEVVWQDRDPGLGLNNTPNTWGYKIPATTTIPLELNVNLFPRADAAEVPDNPNLLMSAKESGEPPMCLAATVYFAVKHAILAARRDRGHDGWFRLDLPCTVQRVREACLVEAKDLTLT